MSLENEKKGLHNPIYPHTKEDINKAKKILTKPFTTEEMASIQHITDDLKEFEIKDDEEIKMSKHCDHYGKNIKELSDTIYKNTINIPMTEAEKISFLENFFDGDKETLKVAGVYHTFQKAAENIHNLIQNGKSAEAVIEVEKLKKELTPSDDKLFLNKEKELYDWCKYYLECYYSTHSIDKEKVDITKQEIAQSKSQEDIVSSQIKQSMNKKQQEIVNWCKQYLVPEAAQYVEQQFCNNNSEEASKYIEKQIQEKGIKLDALVEEGAIKSGKWGQPYPYPSKLVEKWKTILDKTNMYIDGKPYSYYNELPYTEKCLFLQKLQKKKDLSTSEEELYQQLSTDVLSQAKIYLDEYNELGAPVPKLSIDEIFEKIATDSKFDKETKKTYKNQKSISINIKKITPKITLEEIEQMMADMQKINKITPMPHAMKKTIKMKDDIKKSIKKNPKIASSQEMLNNIETGTNILPDKDVLKALKKATKNDNKKLTKLKIDKKYTKPIEPYAPKAVIEAVDKVFKDHPPTPLTKSKRRLKSLSDQELNVIKFSIQLCLANIGIPNTSDEKIIVKLTKEIEIEETLRQEETK